MAALMQGHSHRATAKRLGLPIGTVKAWSAEAKATAQPVEPVIKAQIGPLILEHLQEGLLTLKAHAQKLRNPAKLKDLPLTDLVEINLRYHETVYKLAEALAGGMDAPAEDALEPIEYVPVKP
jgi:transposase